MADVKREFYPAAAQFGSGSFPQFLRNLGTNGPVTWLAYDAGGTESAFWEVGALDYGPADTVLNVDIIWGAATATSGVVMWEVALAAITPETDSTDPQTKVYGTAVTVTDTHLGTTARRLMRATVALDSTAELNSMADGDQLWLKISRLGANGSDTMAGDALLHSALVTWSDS